MKVKLLVLYVLGICGLCRGQDSVPIMYAEETDSLPKQYFIDRYENVFMTKVPTRQMLKLDYTGSDYRGTGFQLGYEYKVLPTLSLELAFYAQRNVGNGLGLGLPIAFNLWTRAGEMVP